MHLRVLSWALASAIALRADRCQPQELARGAPLRPSCFRRHRRRCRPTAAPSACVGDLFRRPLRTLRRAVRAKRTVKVLAIGSSSTVGVGASSPSATYVARLETTLEGAFKGLDFDVIGRGMSGEVAQGAADRMKHEVEETKPDLVVWQVGTNDALRHVSIDKLQASASRPRWRGSPKTRSMSCSIDPQYGEALAKDEYYEKVVAAIAEVAREARVLLVDRFEAMRELQRERGDLFYLTSDNLHLNDRGHRCMAEQLARSIVGGLLQADAEQSDSRCSIPDPPLRRHCPPLFEGNGPLTSSPPRSGAWRPRCPIRRGRAGGRSRGLRRRSAASPAGRRRAASRPCARSGRRRARAFGDLGLVEEFPRARQPRAVDADGHHLEVVRAQLLLQPVERRHLLAAGQAPGRPQVEQHDLAAPVGERALLARRVLRKVTSGSASGVLRNTKAAICPWLSALLPGPAGAAAGRGRWAVARPGERRCQDGPASRIPLQTRQRGNGCRPQRRWTARSRRARLLVVG